MLAYSIGPMVTANALNLQLCTLVVLFGMGSFEAKVHDIHIKLEAANFRRIFPSDDVWADLQETENTLDITSIIHGKASPIEPDSHTKLSDIVEISEAHAESIQASVPESIEVSTVLKNDSEEFNGKPSEMIPPIRKNVPMDNIKVENINVKNMNIENLKLENMKIENMKVENMKVENMKEENKEENKVENKEENMEIIIIPLPHF